MIAKELIALVERERQKEIAKYAVPSMVETILSNEYFERGMAELLKNAYVECCFISLKLCEHSEKPNTIDLEKPIYEGYWVYAYFFSVDYHEYKWYRSKEEAEKQYEKINNTFMGCKMLLHTEQGVLKHSKGVS